jgi:imidazolonepropionase-like amidohydrolase
MRTIALALVVAHAVAAAPAAMAGELLVVRAERVLEDARRGDPAPRTVVIRDGRIVAVLAGADAAIDAHRQAGDVVRERRFDASRTVLPGLVDSHVHLTSNPDRQWWQSAVVPVEASTINGVVNAARTVRAGFTTVRDLGAPRQSAYALRDAIARGEVIGPRILAAGQMISIVGGHGDVGNNFRPEVAEALDAGNTCTGAIQCAERVRRLSRAGADVIKLAATGGVLSQQNRGLDQHFSDEELESIVATAHGLGLRVAAHAHGPRGVAASARAGVDSVEHATFVDADGIRAMKAAGAWLVPTLSPTIAYRENLGTGRYTPVVEAKIRERLEATGRNIRQAHAAGIRIAFGTDAGVSDHGRNAEEFAIMVREGRLTPREALVSATTGAAEPLGLADEIGTLAPGKSADLIAVPGDPLADVTVLERVVFVVARGRIVREPDAD